MGCFRGLGELMARIIQLLCQSSQGSDAPAGPPPATPGSVPATPEGSIPGTPVLSSSISWPPGSLPATPEGSIPGTPEIWPPNPWQPEDIPAGTVQALPQAMRGPGVGAPSPELVKGVVQDIMDKARENAIARITSERARFQYEMQMALDHVSSRRVLSIRLRLPSGQTITCPLQDHMNTLRHLQSHQLPAEIRRHRVQLFIPEVPEALEYDQDLRVLLPGIPELELVILS